MTKSELIDAVAEATGLNKTQAGDAVEAVNSTITDELKAGREVTISGFGKYHVAERGARTGKHPGTGEPIDIPAGRVPRFTAGSGLKAAVKG